MVGVGSVVVALGAHDACVVQPAGAKTEASGAKRMREANKVSRSGSEHSEQVQESAARKSQHISERKVKRVMSCHVIMLYRDATFTFPPLPYRHR